MPNTKTKLVGFNPNLALIIVNVITNALLSNIRAIHLLNIKFNYMLL